MIKRTPNFGVVDSGFEVLYVFMDVRTNKWSVMGDVSIAHLNITIRY